MTEPPDDPEHGLGDRLLDLLVFAPAGAVVTFVEGLPTLAERGRDRLGVRISSARAVGEFVVSAGGQELKRRSTRLVGGSRGRGVPSPSPSPTTGTSVGGDVPSSPPPSPRTAAPPASRPPAAGAGSSASSASSASASGESPAGPAPAAARANGAAAAGPATPPAAGPSGHPASPAPSDRHVPAVDALGIPGFDSLSASQVVQRLDGLNRQELVSVRAYETATRGRRTILSRVDQLLEARA